jgi:predicted 2-oxoglutarate/Fe(II)-dependent dioxygenase YbiX
VPTTDQLAPGIFLVPEFLTEDSVRRVFSEAERHKWEQAYIGYYRDDSLVEKHLNLDERDVEVIRLPHHFDTLVPGYGRSVSSKIAELFGVPDLVVDGFFLSKYSVGSHIRPHSDTGVNSTSRVVTCVQYFNDEYEGGKIQFPQFDIRLKPRPRDLLLFWSEYLHAVEQITAGQRYSMVSFARASAILRLPRAEA